MADIINFSAPTKLDLDPEVVLDAAKNKLESVIIIGTDKDDESYYASSLADGCEILWIVEKFKLFLLRLDEEGMENE